MEVKSSLREHQNLKSCSSGNDFFYDLRLLWALRLITLGWKKKSCNRTLAASYLNIRQYTSKRLIVRKTLRNVFQSEVKIRPSERLIVRRLLFPVQAQKTKGYKRAHFYIRTANRWDRHSPLSFFRLKICNVFIHMLRYFSISPTVPILMGYFYGSIVKRHVTFCFTVKLPHRLFQFLRATFTGALLKGSLHFALQ